MGTIFLPPRIDPKESIERAMGALGHAELAKKVSITRDHYVPQDLSPFEITTVVPPEPKRTVVVLPDWSDTFASKSLLVGSLVLEGSAVIFIEPRHFHPEPLPKSLQDLYAHGLKNFFRKHSKLRDVPLHEWAIGFGARMAVMSHLQEENTRASVGLEVGSKEIDNGLYINPRWHGRLEHTSVKAFLSFPLVVQMDKRLGRTSRVRRYFDKIFSADQWRKRFKWPKVFTPDPRPLPLAAIASDAYQESFMQGMVNEATKSNLPTFMVVQSGHGYGAHKDALGGTLAALSKPGDRVMRLRDLPWEEDPDSKYLFQSLLRFLDGESDFRHEIFSPHMWKPFWQRFYQPYLGESLSNAKLILSHKEIDEWKLITDLLDLSRGRSVLLLGNRWHAADIRQYMADHPDKVFITLSRDSRKEKMAPYGNWVNYNGDWEKLLLMLPPESVGQILVDEKFLESAHIDFWQHRIWQSLTRSGKLVQLSRGDLLASTNSLVVKSIYGDEAVRENYSVSHTEKLYRIEATKRDDAPAFSPDFVRPMITSRLEKKRLGIPEVPPAQIRVHEPPQLKLVPKLLANDDETLDEENQDMKPRRISHELKLLLQEANERLISLGISPIVLDGDHVPRVSDGLDSYRLSVAGMNEIEKMITQQPHWDYVDTFIINHFIEEKHYQKLLNFVSFRIQTDDSSSTGSPLKVPGFNPYVLERGLFLYR